MLPLHEQNLTDGNVEEVLRRSKNFECFKRHLASKNNSLAQINKSAERGTATKKRHPHWVPSQTVAGLIMNESIDLLRCHFDLTPAEARLALHLVAGETLRSAEAKLSITYETARTSLKNVFRKTGTCRQAELVVVIVTALPDCLNQRVTSDSNAVSGEDGKP